MDNMNLNNTLGCVAFEPLYSGLNDNVNGNANSNISNYGFTPLDDGYYGYGYSVPMTRLLLPSGTGVGGQQVSLLVPSFDFQGTSYKNEMYPLHDNFMYSGHEQDFYTLENKLENDDDDPKVSSEQESDRKNYLGVGKMKVDNGDDQSLYGEVSTCATTPVLAALPLVEALEPFDLATGSFGTIASAAANNTNVNNVSNVNYDDNYVNYDNVNVNNVSNDYDDNVNVNASIMTSSTDVNTSANTSTTTMATATTTTTTTMATDTTSASATATASSTNTGAGNLWGGYDFLYDISNQTYTPYSQVYPMNAQPFQYNNNNNNNAMPFYGSCVYGLDGMPIYQGYYHQSPLSNQQPLNQQPLDQYTSSGRQQQHQMDQYLNGQLNATQIQGEVFYDKNYQMPSSTNVQTWSTCDNNNNMACEEASIIEIATEITNNVQYLPAKDMNGKYSLDKNHPIHCVWRDLNRGHCSWRCRWWEDGRRLSKNFNVKRFGDLEAMRMAITMKIRNSTPVERLQLLKEQREAVRNHLELLRQSSLAERESINLPLPNFVEAERLSCNGYSNHNGFEQDAINGADGGTFGFMSLSQTPSASSSSLTSSASATYMNKRQTKTLNNTKRIQRENWQRLSWTYVKVPDRSMDQTSVICRLCAKTTRCSRSRNLQQAHIMHLLRMHKNPWKQYIQVEGLTKMCRAAIEALYQQQGYDKHSTWKLRPGTRRPEPFFT